ncbi:hypothetical protein OESDEN_00766 [Oesophagostomum dentatum]|uniref:Uncharacterized protein n=1 Tax=Oesophagostomum dentatum TaxID=61180 RepID=A0A0B1TNY5_OESDE|nr:hypothetical protein OESDEN_00766 [Oesophagostomum dentatum]
MLTNDAQSRIDDHLSGKLHIAYTRIKEQIDLMTKAKEEKKLQMEKERGREKDDRRRDDRKDDPRAVREAVIAMGGIVVVTEEATVGTEAGRVIAEGDADVSIYL